MISSDPEFLNLFQFVEQNNYKEIKDYDLNLLKQYVNYIDPIEGCTLFIWAIKYCSYSIMEYFLRKANPILTIKSKNGFNAFHWICQIGNSKLLYLYMSYDKFLDINGITSCGQSGLHIAIDNNHLKIVKVLLKNSKINFNIPNSQLETPIMKAIKLNSVPIVKELIKLNPKLDIPDKNNDTPLLLATKLGYKDVLKALFNRVDYSDININDHGSKSIIKNIKKEINTRNKLMHQEIYQDLSEDGKDPLTKNGSKIEELYKANSFDFYNFPYETIDEHEEVDDDVHFSNKNMNKSFNEFFEKQISNNNIVSLDDENLSKNKILDSLEIIGKAEDNRKSDLLFVVTSFKEPSSYHSSNDETIPISLSPSNEKNSSLRSTDYDSSYKSIDYSPTYKTKNAWFSSKISTNKISPFSTTEKPRLSLIHPDYIHEENFIPITHKGCCTIS